MLKRANKVAALLIAAASMISMVPAMAADTQKLSTMDGTIESAVAFSDGKYLYQGYKSDDDDDGIYYNAGGKDKYLDDVEDSDLEGSYDTKYAFAKDGSDEYLIDLSNGSVTDDTTPSDNLDTATSKLRTNLRKTDRYGQLESSAINLERADKGPKFSDVWYSYEATPLDGADGKDYTFNGKLYGFTNQSGKYIDISTTANIYAYSSQKGKVVKIEDFTNDYTDVDNDSKLSATLAAAPELLTQDKDNFYVKVKVNIYDQAAGTGDLVGTTTAAAASIDGNAAVLTTHTYIQKISKAQGDKKDDAYIPKTVASYEVTKGVFDSGDADDAYSAIEGTDTFSVVNGQLLAINHSGDNVKVTSINLKKDKVKFESAKPTSFTSEKVDVYLAEKDDSDDVDVKDSGNAYDIDVNGNVWVVAKGKIYEFKNNEMTKVYSCDSSLDSISVYDADNLITWEDDGDIYSTVSESGSDTTPVDPAKTGWDKLADGTWNFYDSTGTKVVNKWVNDGGVWYYLKADGVMATSWLNDNGTWYFLNGSGAMKTGWINDNGTWYFLNSSGAMATGWVNDSGTWYFLKSSGAMATGWVNDNGTWYFLNSSGAMLANTTVDGYKLGASGAWIG
ncbi:cell wall binding repeat-containing protein [Clostridium sp. DL-VIII]|uniref:N-acetylmuramoyl-L-alanine amidase family protein n=1 Tax=Clostridium sp. DL-VIII TaxID=641107 RepID=UPI00023AF6E3|nr:N-acetylmuramoyl-L-alanine amidase family protein [Clostridium sp. DL-VIII]EHI96804.1 cell wall binding repeat-containing protein [Clostridium sp. DL-VIII]